jgi:hypothetical protein
MAVTSAPEFELLFNTMFLQQSRVPVAGGLHANGAAPPGESAAMFNVRALMLHRLQG